jgi:L-alanine-DL-glutamate epimerase-like enolase superfamily enzyme
MARVLTSRAQGWGWSYTQGVGGEMVAGIARTILAPTMVGQAVEARDAIWQRFYAASYSVGMVGMVRLAASALDIALWDAWARERGQNLSETLGGPIRAQAPAYYSSINLNSSLEALEEEARQARLQGFSAYKMKVGRPDLRDDQRRIQCVRALGLDVMVDANQRFSGAEAAQRVRGWRDAGASFVEEPIGAYDWEGYRQLAAQSDITIAAGESLYQPEWFPVLMQTGVKVIQPDIFRVGGLTPLQAVLSRASAKGVSVMLHCGEELAAWVALSSEVVGPIEHLPAIQLSELGLCEQTLRVGPGSVQPLTSSGHGVTFDIQHLGQFRLF